MKKFNPLVSIIIPVFNGANYLEGAISSALNQTYTNIEILVINDGSQDNLATERIAKKFGNKVRYFYQENGGCGAALNCGIKHMRGEYFSWLSHDDLYTPEKVSTQVSLLEKLVNKNTIIFSAFELIDQHSNHTSFVYPHKVLAPDQLIKPLMPLLRGLINGCALLIPKKLFDEIGIFDVSKRTTQDYALWFDLLRKAPLEYVNQPLIKCRIHAEQDTQKINALHLQECNELWSGFMERLSQDEIKKLDGSRFGFLANMADHLAITPYHLARQKALQEMLDIIAATKVSVLVIADGNPEALNQSLESIGQQTHCNIDIYVVHEAHINAPNMDYLAHRGIKICSQSFVNTSSKNLAMIDAINQSHGEFIAFLEAGDLFKPDKLFEQIYFMLRQDASIAITAIEENNELGLSLSECQPIKLNCKGFPIVVFELDRYFSTLMVKADSIQLFTSSPNTIMRQDIPSWNQIFTLYEVRYLSKELTLLGDHTIYNFSHLQRYLLQNMLQIVSICSKEFVLATNLSHRLDTQRSSLEENFIAYQLTAFRQYEEKIIEFWGAKEPNYATILIRAEFNLIKLHLQIIIRTYFYRMRRLFINIRHARLADYEGFLVKLFKPLIPSFAWRYATNLYHKTKQLMSASNN